jgi:triosephosphate isomerase
MDHAGARRTLVVGNWKMNGSLASNQLLLDAIAGRDGDSSGRGDVAVCVPAPYLAQVARRLAGSRVAWGAQDVSEHESGAYTGETSAAMLRDFGCRYAIVGHSERRTLFGDSDERVAAKAERAIAAGLVPIVCIGETLAEREQGRAAPVVQRQLDAVLERIGVAGLSQAVVAYEPVWAIGTGKTASPEEAQAMHAMIRAQVTTVDGAVARRLQLLYGGSVKASNARALFACEDIDGGLIGGASLVASDFLAIVDAASAS